MYLVYVWTDGRTTDKKCTRCGNDPQPYLKCPAKGKQCSKCKLYNHFAAECRSKPVHLVDGSDRSSDSDDFQTMSINSDRDMEFSEILQISNRKVKFQLDSGAKCHHEI